MGSGSTERGAILPGTIEMIYSGIFYPIFYRT